MCLFFHQAAARCLRCGRLMKKASLVHEQPDPFAAATPLGEAEAMRAVRAEGRVTIGFKMRGAATVIADLAEGGGYRAKLPAMTGRAKRSSSIRAAAWPAAMIFVAGSDLAHGAQALSQASRPKKIYRSSGWTAGSMWKPTSRRRIAVVGCRRKASCFPAHGSRAGLRRTSQRRRLLMVETVIFGRIARAKHWEGAFSERWRIRRSGRLVFADDWRLDGLIGAALRRPAVLNGMCAVAQSADRARCGGRSASPSAL